MEMRYSNIDREMLAIVFGIEKFHIYLYGRQFEVLLDHKPLNDLSKEHQKRTGASATHATEDAMLHLRSKVRQGLQHAHL